MVCFIMWLFFFFFKQKTAYEMRISDWSSDVCSSDLLSSSRPCGRRSPSICRWARRPAIRLASDSWLQHHAARGRASFYDFMSTRDLGKRQDLADLRGDDSARRERHHIRKLRAADAAHPHNLGTLEEDAGRVDRDILTEQMPDHSIAAKIGSAHV